MSNNGKYKIGDQVQLKRDPSQIGFIVALGPIFGKLQYYRIQFVGGSTQIVSEADFQPYTPNLSPSELLIQSAFGSYDDFQRLLTYHRLKKDKPITDTIYAFNASRTRSFPYQFKPLMKFLDSSNHRILICDEVGLGKTIEAGLILTEMQARQMVERVLVVCPAGLLYKWKFEMKNRFDEEFRIYRSGDFSDFLDEYQANPDTKRIRGIVSYQAIRSESIIKKISEYAPEFDLLIFDEAHHLRNFGTKTRKSAENLCVAASAVIMLTATPVHLGSQNLFSLLNLLDEEEFRDLEITDQKFRDNENIVKIQMCLSQLPPNIISAKECIERAKNTGWFAGNPLFREFCSEFDELCLNNGQSNDSSRQLIELQGKLTSLNLIGHLFTRTRKREVSVSMVERRAFSYEVSLTADEKTFYDMVTNLIRMRCASPELDDRRRNFVNVFETIIPQRRMASSIAAMVDFYRDETGILDEKDEDIEKIINLFPRDYDDSKFTVFLEMLKNIGSQENMPKVIVFAFFKGTLKYLHKQLRGRGFKSELITGDVPPDERQAIIDKFRDTFDIDILLSSNVGGEGLDFQFCDTVINYDLPWNPMELEQRIGRLDRIGQESPVIRIYNLWVKDTIEERVLRRLYDRIKIFERTIGGLEMILGDVVQKMIDDLFRGRLTEEEERQIADRALVVLQQKLHDLERLESEAAQFIGTDYLIDEQIESVRAKKKYITGEQLYYFVYDYIKHHAQGSRIEYNQDTNKGKMYLNETARAMVREYRSAARVMAPARIVNHGIEFTFDPETAFKNPKIEFVSVLHPLVQSIVYAYSRNNRVFTGAYHIRLESDSIDCGEYFFFIYKLEIHSAKPKNYLLSILLTTDFEIYCSPEDSEIILGEMLEKGQNPCERIEIDNQMAQKAVHRAESKVVEYINNLKENEKKNNDYFIERRLDSIDKTFKKIIKKKEDMRGKAVRENKDPRYIRMLDGTINRLKNELDDAIADIQRSKHVEVNYSEVAAGFLEVC